MATRHGGEAADEGGDRAGAAVGDPQRDLGLEVGREGRDIEVRRLERERALPREGLDRTRDREAAAAIPGERELDGPHGIGARSQALDAEADVA